jgi:hypothetical protein
MRHSVRPELFSLGPESSCLELPAKINQMKTSDQHEGLVSDIISRLAAALMLVEGGGGRMS